MTFTPANVVPDDPVYLTTYSRNSMGSFWRGLSPAAPSSGTFFQANRVMLTPFFTSKLYSLARWCWLNGATVGTNYLQAGIFDSDLNLFKASPKTLSAGTASQMQHVSPGIHGTNVTAGSSSTDATSYTTASVTLKAGVLYLMAVENSKATADVVSAITGGPTFTSRSSTLFNTNGNRVSIWSAVPTVDYTGTLVIDFGGGNTQTGAVWALNAFYHVDTATTDGVVQQAVGTGSSVTPLATLAAFGSANNATFGAFGVGSTSSGAPSAGYFEMNDTTAATPAQALQTVYRPDNDTTVDETITSAAWGACAVEIKSLGTGAISIPPMRGFIGLWGNGTTATIFRVTSATLLPQVSYYISAVQATGFPTTATLTTQNGSVYLPVVGFTSRSSP